MNIISCRKCGHIHACDPPKQNRLWEWLGHSIYALAVCVLATLVIGSNPYLDIQIRLVVFVVYALREIEQFFFYDNRKLKPWDRFIDGAQFMFATEIYVRVIL